MAEEIIIPTKYDETPQQLLAVLAALGFSVEPGGQQAENLGR